MIISKYNNLELKINTDYKIIEEIYHEFSLYVDNYMFMPEYQIGRWNGKIDLFNIRKQTLPYGLIGDLTRYIKINFPNVKIQIEDDVKSMYSGVSNIPKYNLTKKPYYYQDDCIKASLKFTKGLIKSATGSGKSLTIAYIIKSLLDMKLIKQALIVVPKISLVDQFNNDMIDYGIDEKHIGNVHAQRKEFDKPITISTWQSLMHNHHKLSKYECVIFDECHLVKSFQLSKIAMKCTNAKFRYGFTGTLPTNKLELYQIKSYIGPVLRDYGADKLSKEGFLSECNINTINIEYKNKVFGDYNNIKNDVFTNEKRMKIISHLSNKTDDNILILVGLVEKEGDVLYKYMKENTKKTVVFLNGKTNVQVREEWRKKLNESKNIIIIATYGIASMGLNIPSLKCLILASPFKSEIRTLQSIGRTLRYHINKPDGAIVYDIIDNVKYLNTHGKKRIKYYEKENFNVQNIDNFTL